MSGSQIYLDYNATHPPDVELIRASYEKYYRCFGNTSGRSLFSQKSNSLLEQAREKAARILHVEPEQIIFTSSATEANFLAIHIIYQYIKNIIKKDTIHIGVSYLEHPSVEEVLHKLPDINIVRLPLDSSGRIDLNFLEAQLKTNRLDLLVCMLVHNETGIVQPMEQIFELLERYPVFFLCDAVQSLARLGENEDCDGLYLSMFSKACTLPVFFTFSGHKIGAGFGTGVMVRPSLQQYENLSECSPYAGGAQEFSIRAGSHNVASVISFAEVLSSQVKKRRYSLIKKVTDQFEKSLKDRLGPIMDIQIVGKNSPRLAGTTLAIFKGLPIDFFLMGLDESGIIVSTGTSCKSRSRKASMGLLSMGLTEEEALSVIRFSYDENFFLENQRSVLKVTHALASKLGISDLKEVSE